VISKEFFADQRKVTTPSGTISYLERSNGPVALFVHAVLLNRYLWRHQSTKPMVRACRVERALPL
jgi:hypothetical protein